MMEWGEREREREREDERSGRDQIIMAEWCLGSIAAV